MFLFLVNYLVTIEHVLKFIIQILPDFMCSYARMLTRLTCCVVRWLAVITMEAATSLLWDSVMVSLPSTSYLTTPSYTQSRMRLSSTAHLMTFCLFYGICMMWWVDVEYLDLSMSLFALFRLRRLSCLLLSLQYLWEAHYLCCLQ